MKNDASETPIKNIRWDGRSVVVEAAGEIDLYRSAAFQQALLELLDDGPECIVINLDGVPYMDSSGVAALVKLLSRARRIGVSLKLASLTARVRSVFEITRLDGVFNIFETEQEAMSG